MSHRRTSSCKPLLRLRTTAAALRETSRDGLAPDAGLDLADTALIARSLAGLTACLPDVIATMKTAIDHAGTPMKVDD